MDPGKTAGSSLIRVPSVCFHDKFESGVPLIACRRHKKQRKEIHGSHRLEKYLNIQDCLKSLKIKFALKNTQRP